MLALPLLSWLSGYLAFHGAAGVRTNLTSTNRGRLLNPIQVVRFPQEECTVVNGPQSNILTTGICLSASECSARSGIVLGEMPVLEVLDNHVKKELGQIKQFCTCF